MVADEGSALAVVGAEKVEDEGEELLGEVSGTVLSDSLGDGGEELRQQCGPF